MLRLAGTLLALCALAHAQFVRPNYAITNAKVIVSPGKTIDSATILVRDGLIESVGSNVPIPPDARVYDATGLTIYPGLIDAATHYGFTAPVRTFGTPLPTTVTTIAASVPEDIASPDKYLRPQPTGVNPAVSATARMAVPPIADPRRTYGFTTVLSVPREGHWQGTSALVNLKPGAANEAVVMSPVAMHVNFATSFGSGGSRYPSSLMGVFAVLRQSLVTAQQYREKLRIYESAGRSGLPRPAPDEASEALLPVLDGKIPVMFAADSAEQIRRANRFADEFKLRTMILGGAEAWKVADLLKARGVPVLVSLSLAAPAVGRSMFATGPEAEQAPNSPERIAAEENPGKLEKAGVKWAFATGAWERPDQIREKIATAIRRGLPADAALRALTIYPAEILGVASQVGSIEKGKIANLALAEGDLLGTRARLRGVMVDGIFYFAGPAAGPTISSRRAPGQPGQQAQPGVPTTGDDPAPATPGAAKPANTAASSLPERRPPTPETAPRDLVIKNATILTITKGTIDNGSIWLHDGKIQEVGASVKAPADAKVIDGTGRFVMPGIIDSHSHSAISGGVNEVGPSVTAQCRITDVLSPDDVNLYREVAAGVTTLNILHGSANAIGGQNATIKLKWGSSAEQMLFPGAPRGIKMALGENPKRSNSVGSTRSVRFPATRMGVENVIRETFKAGKEYKRLWEEYDAKVARNEKAMPPERNLTLDAIRDVLDGKILVHAHCYRADEISMLLDVADEYGFKIRSLQHVLEGYKVAEKIRKHGAGASTFADFWGYKMEAFDGTAYNAALLVKAGVRTAVNSDSDERARRLYHEAAKAMKYGGLTEDQALRLITTEPAWMLGVEKRVGALEQGMDADIAVFNAHPLSAYARVEMTLVDGQIVFDRERDLKSRVPWREEFERNTDTPTSGGFDEEDDH